VDVTFLFRTQRWRLQRAVRTQVSWDRARHRAVYRWEVTFTNGAFVRYSVGKWLVIAIIKARYGFDNEPARQRLAEGKSPDVYRRN